MLRNLFGASKREIWRQLSEQIGARYVEGGFLKGDKVEATHGEWIVTLGTYARLQRLYELFAETLDELCRMGSAYNAAPDVRL